jgi:hypothetical protein
MFLGTGLSILIVILLNVVPLLTHQLPLTIDGPFLPWLMIGLSSLCLFIFAYLNSTSWDALQTAEKKTTARIIDLFQKDGTIKVPSIFLCLFPLLSIALALGYNWSSPANKLIWFSIWLVLFGMGVDLIYTLIKNIRNFLNPFSIIEKLTHAAKGSIQNERELDLCSWIDALSEIAVKASSRSSPILANDSVDELQKIAKVFLESSKSISHRMEDAETKKLGISDKISYTLFYLFQRLELINDKALEHKLEPVCSNNITALGKITIDSAKLDMTLARYPLHYLGKFADRAEQHHMAEVGVKATLTLLEVAKTMAAEIDMTYLVIKDPYISLINHLYDIAKETFKQDKSIPIEVLTHPFRELKELFSTEKLANHQDTPEIMAKLNNVLGEFDALQMIMKTLPPLPKISEEQVPENPLPPPVSPA